MSNVVEMQSSNKKNANPSSNATEGGKETGSKGLQQSVVLKRTVTVKSMVTAAFRERAASELSDEVAVLDNQLGQLEAQFQQALGQLEEAARAGHNVARQLDQLHREAEAKRQQLSQLKQDVSTQLANLDTVSDGTYVITGQLDNYVDVKVGDNLYDKIRGAEVLLKDGVVTAILG